MTVRVLSPKVLNRTVLARQLLLERSPAPLPRALERVGGLQTQYAPSGYIGLWSRLREFRRNTLTVGLEKRRVVQATLMRATIHMVSAADFPLFAAGVRETRQQWWLAQQRGVLDGADMDAVASTLRTLLADGPRRATDLSKALADAGFPKAAWNGAGMWVDLVRVPPSGTWERRRADLYGLAEQWVPTAGVDPAQGVRHLVERYLSGFGPAAPRDIANWAGLAPSLVNDTVAAMSLRRFLDAEGAELVDIARAPVVDGSTPAPVRFLPTWDATLLSHARRANILPAQYREFVFSTKMPQSIPTFLVDGAVAGTWREDNGRVTIKPFDRLPARVRRDLDEEAQALSAFLA